MGQAAIQNEDADLNQPSDQLDGQGQPEGQQQKPVSLAMSRLEEIERISASRLANPEVVDEFVDIDGNRPVFESPKEADDGSTSGNELNPEEAPSGDEVPAGVSKEIPKEETKPAAQMVRVKLDGQELDLPIEEVIAGYQKNEVASRRMTEATKKLSDAEARERAIAEREAKITSPAAPEAGASDKQVSTPEQRDETFQAAAKGFIDALYGSDEADAVTKLEALVKAGRGPDTKAPATPDLEQITAQITPRIKQQIEVESALQTFAQEFPEIVADPYLESRNNGFLAEIVQAGGKSPIDSLREAGGKTRDWLKQLTGTAAPAQPSATTTQNPDRLNRKQNLDRVRPASAVQSRATAIPEESPQVRRNTIEEMARARGKPI